MDTKFHEMLDTNFHVDTKLYEQKVDTNCYEQNLRY